MSAAGRLLANQRWFRTAGAFARAALRRLPRRVGSVVARGWSRERDLPELPPQSFHAWYRFNRPGVERPEQP